MKFILVNGLSRSGNHAIIRWITAQYEDSGFEVFFHNNATIKRLENLCLRGGGGLHGLPVPNPSIFEVLMKITKNDKRVFIMSIEDLILNEKVQNLLNIADKNIIILRDPMNLFASRIQGLTPPRGKKNSIEFDDKQDFEIQKYLSQYREFIGETNYLKNKVGINYNSWVCDVDYRKEISEKLEVNFTDSKYNQRACSSFGPKSTIQLESKNPEDFLTRYKTLWNDPWFEKIKNNSDLLRISKENFGLNIDFD